MTLLETNDTNGSVGDIWVTSKLAVKLRAKFKILYTTTASFLNRDSDTGLF